MTVLFQVGQIVATPGALAAFRENDVNPAAYLRRHLTGDWGDLCADDKRLNDAAVHNGTRILSAYKLPDCFTRIYIITEADRSSTTFLLPEEY